jgi:hypothetical protein
MHSIGEFLSHRWEGDTMEEERPCEGCAKVFYPRNKAQRYCLDSSCQRARKSRWQKRKIADDIDRACARANRYHAYDADAVKRILAAIATPRTLESVRNEKARSQLRQKLPPIKQRDLAEYSHLFGKEPIDENSRSNDGADTQSSANAENETHGEGT